MASSLEGIGKKVDGYTTGISCSHYKNITIVNMGMEYGSVIGYRTQIISFSGMRKLSALCLNISLGRAENKNNKP